MSPVVAERPTPERLHPASDISSWLVVWLAAPVVLLFGAIMVKRLADCPKGIRADFVQEWTSAKNCWSGYPIYEPLTASIPRYLHAAAPSHLAVNAHPPGAVLLALPFARLEYRSAWLAWNLLSLALLGVGLWLLMRPQGLGFRTRDAIPVAAVLLAGNPLAQQVIEGQMNLVLLALLTAAWVADRGQRSVAAGALVGLAAAIKLFPAFVVVYFIARRQWTAVMASGLAFAGASALSMAMFGPDVFLVYGRDVLPAFQHFAANLANASLPGIWQKAFVGIPGQSTPVVFAPFAAKLGSLVSGALVACLCGWRSAVANDRRERDLAYAACLVGMLLASPITWGHSFVLLTIPALIVWRHAQPRVAGRLLLLALVVLLGIVRQGWIWNALVPGFEEMTLGVAPADFRVQPGYALTVLSYGAWALLAMLSLIVLQAPQPARVTLRSCTR